jgi:hypothetical protein
MGFSVETQLECMDSYCLGDIKQIMDLCEERGVAMVVRVVPDSHKDIGFNIMSVFLLSCDVPILTCSNLDEATQALAD